MDVDEWSANALGSTVTPEVLTESSEGGLLASGYDPLESYLEANEQPHFVFVVERVFSGVWDDGLEAGKHIRVVITDRYVRTISETLDVALYYDRLAAVGSLVKGDRCALILEGSGFSTTYLVGSPNEAELVPELRDAVQYIRDRRSSVASGLE